MEAAAGWQRQQLGGCLAVVADAGVAAEQRWQSGGSRAAAPAQSGGSAAEAVPVSCINFVFLQMLPLSNICTSVTNLHTISHFIFDNVKFVLAYGRVVVA